jgi:hypothetical protein
LDIAKSSLSIRATSTIQQHMDHGLVATKAKASTTAITIAITVAIIV